MVTSEAFLWGFEGSRRGDEAVWTHCRSFLRTCVTFVTCFAPFTFLLLYIHGQFELCNIRISVSTNIWGVHRTYFRLPVIQVVTTSIRTEHQPCTTFPQPPFPLELVRGLCGHMDSRRRWGEDRHRACDLASASPYAGATDPETFPRQGSPAYPPLRGIMCALASHICIVAYSNN